MDHWILRLKKVMDLENSHEEEKLGKAVEELASAIVAILPPEESLVDDALNFQKIMRCEKNLPSCAACGIRALPTDEEYKRFALDDLQVVAWRRF